MKYINILFLLLGFAYSIVAQSNDALDLSSFPKNFHSGELSTGVDCENMKFLKNGTFIYKFTGDCKGWSRKLKGIWKKREDHLELSGFMYENYQEGKIGCTGSYYHTNTKEEREKCIKEYKENIKLQFGSFPVKLSLYGKVWVTKDLTVGVGIETYLISKSNKEKIKGLMFFSDEKFGKFTNYFTPLH